MHCLISLNFGATVNKFPVVYEAAVPVTNRYFLMRLRKGKVYNPCTILLLDGFQLVLPIINGCLPRFCSH